MANFKTNAMRILDSAKVNYKVYTYESGGDFDGQSVARKIGVDENCVFKTLVAVAPSKNHYVFVVPVNRELDLKACARAVGEKSVEMIAVKDINKVTGYIRGGCSPIGMKKQYVTVVDSACLSLEKMVFSAGKIGYQVELAPSDLLSVTGAKTDSVAR